jgi:hypothetical protein
MFTLLKDKLKDDGMSNLVKDRFGRLGMVMMTLITDGAYIDGVGVDTRAFLESDLYIETILFHVFVLLSALTVMNMLIGVLCEVVTVVAATEKEDSQIRLVKDKLLVMLHELDEDGSGMISVEEMGQVLDNEGALSVLDNLNVDTGTLLDQLTMCYEERDDLTIHEIMDLILMLRGDRSPTMRDLLHSQQFTRWKLAHALRGHGVAASLSHNVLSHPVSEHFVERQATLIEKATRSKSIRETLSPGTHTMGSEGTQQSVFPPPPRNEDKENNGNDER